MGDSTITSQGIVLYDRWPGYAVAPPVENITDMTSTLVGHNQVTKKYDLGTKWVLYNHGAAGNIGVKYHEGFSTFVYLKCADDIETAIAGAVDYFVAPDGTMAAGMADDRLYTVTADSDSTTHETMGLIACCLSTMTNSYYGWFWCGGVAPLEYVSGMTITSVFQCLDDVYSAATITALQSCATAATEIGFGAAATDGATQIIGEAIYEQGT